jgi:hypothetical protein
VAVRVKMPTIARRSVRALEDLPNVGKSIAGDLRLLGITRPAQLRGRNPRTLYDALGRATGARQDPCVLDTFMSIVDFMNGAPARPWWMYTAERKRQSISRRARPR